MSEKSGFSGDTIVSGLIATTIALVCVYLVSLAVPFPWTLGSTLLATGIASFSGSVVSYILGFRAARSTEGR